MLVSFGAPVLMMGYGEAVAMTGRRRLGNVWWGVGDRRRAANRTPPRVAISVTVSGAYAANPHCITKYLCLQPHVA